MSREPESGAAERALTAALERLLPLLARQGIRVSREPLPDVQAEPAVLTQVFEKLIGAILLNDGAEAGTELAVSAHRDRKVVTFEFRRRPAGQGPLRGLSEALWACRELLRPCDGEIWSEAEAASWMRVVLSLPASPA